MEIAVNTWYCAVSVATVWTSPDGARAIDNPGLANPVRLVEWLEKLPFEQRLDLCDSNRIQTQLVYGEPVIVEEIQENWAKIIAVWQPSRKDERGYPGWVPLAQLKEAGPIEATGFVKVVVEKAQLWTNDFMPSLVVPLNTVLPYTEEQEEFVQVCTPDGTGLLLSRDVEKAPSIHQFTKKSPSEGVDRGLCYLDLPYFWGGMSTYGYDCSGFTFNMLKTCGHLIPRDATDQAIEGLEISLNNRASWMKGDLLFFANDLGKGKVRHVGFYYGNGLLLHSPSTGKTIELLKLTGSSLENELCAVRRYGVTEEEKE